MMWVSMVLRCYMFAHQHTDKHFPSIYVRDGNILNSDKEKLRGILKIVDCELHGRLCELNFELL